MKQKTCKVCRATYAPRGPLQVVCSPVCALQHASKIREKKAKAAQAEEKRQDKAKKESFKTIAQLIADAQKPFNEYIRLRDKDKGCFVCGCAFSEEPGRVQHAGHARSRGAAGHLRFNELNVMGECEGCNGPHGAKPHEIKAGAIARIGLAAWEALETDNTPHKWTREELIAIKAEYMAKAKELRNGLHTRS